MELLREQASAARVLGLVRALVILVLIGLTVSVIPAAVSATASAGEPSRVALVASHVHTAAIASLKLRTAAKLAPHFAAAILASRVDVTTTLSENASGSASSEGAIRRRALLQIYRL